MAKRSNSTRLLLWELGCVFWICFAGSTLHFAFELTNYWLPMAVISAVNESVWEHLKIYFWPGLVYALAQYTYTRDIANNYWLGKMVALTVTPIAIIIMYHSYIAYAMAVYGKSSIGPMLAIMFFGVLIGQLCSWRILSRPPIRLFKPPQLVAGYVTLMLMFSVFTFFPPRIFLFENYFCYEYTAEYGILDDYGPYKMFRRPEDMNTGGNSIWYCNNQADASETRRGNPVSEADSESAVVRQISAN